MSSVDFYMAMLRYNMNRLLLAVILVAVIIISGCSKSDQASNNTESAVTVFERSIDASKNINTLEIEYSVNMNGVVANGKDFIKGDKMASIVEIRTGDIATNARVYSFGSDLYSCITSPPNNEWICSKQQLAISIDKDSQIKFLEQMYKNRALNFVEDVKTKNINGFECKEIHWSTDIKKLSKEEKYFILASSGLVSLPNMEELANGISSFETTQCITKDGIEVDRNVTLDLGTNKIELKTKVSGYKVNQPIDDSIFTLPDSQNK